MSDFTLEPLALEGLARIHQRVFNDARGRFARLFCQGRLTLQGRPFDIRQINHSTTQGAGSVRGLHYQLPGHAESKLITCLEGAILDIVVDIRQGSPTFLHWHAERLEAGDGHSLLIPKGFAHGFQALAEQVQVLYFTDADYAPGHEGGLRHDDPALNLPWPLPVTNLSERDQQHPLLTPAFTGVAL